MPAYRLRAAEEHDLAAALAGARAKIEDAIRLEHDLRVMLDHDQRVARIAQPLHHPDHPLHVARVQADGGLVEHEQRVDEGSAEGRGEVDALHFAARERARLTIEREVAEAHVREVAEAAADLPEQQIGRLIQWPRQLQLLEERVAAFHRQQHQVVDRKAGQCGQLRGAPLNALGPKARRGAERGIGQRLVTDPPQQRLGLQARAVADAAGSVGTVARQQYAHVHLVGACFQPGEEALHPVPDLLRPGAFALDHPLARLAAELAPGSVQGDAAQLANFSGPPGTPRTTWSATA